MLTMPTAIGALLENVVATAGPYFEGAAGRPVVARAPGFPAAGHHLTTPGNPQYNAFQPGRPMGYATPGEIDVLLGKPRPTSATSKSGALRASASVPSGRLITASGRERGAEGRG